MNRQAIVFDLDGTLLDTLDDIADSVNRALEREGFPPHPIASYRRFIGDGVVMLMRRALPPDRQDDATVTRCVAAYRDSYAEGWNVKTRPYPGIAELLDAVTARALPMAVLSNKPDQFTQLCVSEYLGRWPFQVVLGQLENLPRKPDPTSALLIAARLELSPDACWFLGDSVADMEAARRAGMRAIAVAWGFRPEDELRAAGAEAVIAQPLEFLELLDHPSRLAQHKERGS